MAKDRTLGIKTSLKELKQAKKQFCRDTFSKDNLVNIAGLKNEEVDKIPSVVKFGLERYERFTVWEYLKYDKKIGLK